VSSFCPAGKSEVFYNTRRLISSVRIIQRRKFGCRMKFQQISIKPTTDDGHIRSYQPPVRKHITARTTRVQSWGCDVGDLFYFGHISCADHRQTE